MEYRGCPESVDPFGTRGPMTSKIQSDIMKEEAMAPITSPNWTSAMSEYIRNFHEVRKGHESLCTEFYDKVFQTKSTSTDVPTLETTKSEDEALYPHACYNVQVVVNGVKVDTCDFAVQMDDGTFERHEKINWPPQDPGDQKNDWVFDNMVLNIRNFLMQRYKYKSKDEMIRSVTHKTVAGEIYYACDTFVTVGRDAWKEGHFPEKFTDKKGKEKPTSFKYEIIPKGWRLQNTSYRIGGDGKLGVLRGNLTPDFEANLEYEDDLVMAQCSNQTPITYFYMYFDMLKENEGVEPSHIQLQFTMNLGMENHAIVKCSHVITGKSQDPIVSETKHQYVNVSNWSTGGLLYNIPHLSLCEFIARQQRVEMKRDSNNVKVCNFSVSHKERGVTFVYANVYWEEEQMVETFFVMHMSKIHIVIPDFSQTTPTDEDTDEPAEWKEQMFRKSLTSRKDNYRSSLYEKERQELWKKLKPEAEDVHEDAKKIKKFIDNSMPNATNKNTSSTFELRDTRKELKPFVKKCQHLYNRGHENNSKILHSKIFVTFPWHMFTFLKYSMKWDTERDEEQKLPLEHYKRPYRQDQTIPALYIDEFYTEFARRVCEYVRNAPEKLQDPGTLEQELEKRVEAQKQMAKDENLPPLDFKPPIRFTVVSTKRNSRKRFIARAMSQMGGHNERAALQNKAHVPNMDIQLASAAEAVHDMGLAVPIGNTPSYQRMKTERK